MTTKRKTADPQGSATMDSLKDWPADVTPPAQQEVARLDDVERQAPGADDEPIDAEFVAAAGRAAEYIRARNYGPSTITIVQYIAAHAADTAELNAVILEQMAERMLAATDPSQILDPFGTMAGKEMYGRPLWVTGVTFLESDYEEGFPYYVSMAYQDSKTGRTSVVTVGGEKLVMQAAVFDMRGAWPVEVAIHQSDKETKQGFRPLELRAIT